MYLRNPLERDEDNKKGGNDLAYNHKMQQTRLTDDKATIEFPHPDTSDKFKDKYSKELVDLVKRMLDIDRNTRIGARNDKYDILKHEVFEELKKSPEATAKYL